MSTIPNGRTRKNLSEQLDRLDAILDGLAEALNESVATAVKDATAQAVQQAVETTLHELLTSPELMTLIGAARAPVPVAEPAPPPLPPSPGLRDRLRSTVGWARQKFHSARQACGRKLSGLRPRFLALWDLRRQLLIAIAVGGVAGLGGRTAGGRAARCRGGVHHRAGRPSPDLVEPDGRERHPRPRDFLSLPPR